MIPLHLRLKNFLSYREATLDFSGLHVACVCGANGAGKSSLLEAIAWAVWGQSRGASEDDIVHQGEAEARVDFTFACQQQDYRIVRTRHRGQGGTLEFQVKTPSGFRALTARGMRATQQLIQQHVRLDFETFVNSAYLRQGRADEFMLKRPGERKQILADLLKLDQYDLLAERAKERSRQLRTDLAVLERTLDQAAIQIQQMPAVLAQIAQIEQQLAELQRCQEADAAQLQQYQAIQQQRSAWQQEYTLQQQQRQRLQEDCDRLQTELHQGQTQLQVLANLLTEADAIATGYRQFQELQARDEQWTARLQAHQTAQQQLQQLQQQHTAAIDALQQQIQHLQGQQATLHQQDQDLQQILSKESDIAAALQQLTQARDRLATLDHLQAQAAPLAQRRQQLQQQLDQQQMRLTARLEELKTTIDRVQQQQETHPELQRAIAQVAEQIDYLEKRRAYQLQVREKGTERRNFMERLQERQRDYERQLADLDHKISLLHPTTPPLHHPTSLPPCPLCDRPLDAQHRTLVLERHQTEKQEILNQLWVLREQLTTSEREIKVLRQEYRELEQELACYGKILEHSGRLQAQFHAVADGQQQLVQLIHEQRALEQHLQQESYAADLRQELWALEDSLQRLHYDDRDHALARGQVDQWRWAEIKQAEIRQAQKQRIRLAQQFEELEVAIAHLTQQLEAEQTSPRQQEMARLNQYIATVGYDSDRHAAVREALRQAQPYQLRYQELTQAQQQYPVLHQQLEERALLFTERQELRQATEAQLAWLEQQLAQSPDGSATLSALEQQMRERRSHLDTLLAQLGQIQQQRQQLEQIQEQMADQQAEQQMLRRQLRVHQELVHAFGRNGIQALIIETVLPQLEAESNQILGRLSANQLHIQFVTQRASKHKQKSLAREKAAAYKLIDTLDILISDTQGTRPYET
ncbi:MAG: AAA family ATPase [Synechococcales bacterium]|nr:AAA family ATPase [Synechococcales bacterium]